MDQILTIGFTLLFIISTFLYLRRSYYSRNSSIQSEDIELNLNDIQIHWWWITMWGIFTALHFGQKENTSFEFIDYIYLFLFADALFMEACNYLMQTKINRDRLILGKEEIVLLADWKQTIDTHTIEKISLNGFTNTIKIVGNNTLRFSKDRLSDDSMRQLIAYLEEEVGFEKLKVSENFMRIVRLNLHN